MSLHKDATLIPPASDCCLTRASVTATDTQVGFTARAWCWRHRHSSPCPNFPTEPVQTQCASGLCCGACAFAYNNLVTLVAEPQEVSQPLVARASARRRCQLHVRPLSGLACAKSSPLCPPTPLSLLKLLLLCFCNSYITTIQLVRSVYLMTLSTTEITFSQWWMNEYGAMLEWHLKWKGEVLGEKHVWLSL